MDRGLRELLEQSPVLRVLVPGLLLVFGAFGLLHYATDPSMMPLIPRETIEASHSSDGDSSTADDSQTATADARSADASDAKTDTTGATAASQDADPQPAGMVASLHASAGGLAAKLTSP